jgi:hypothetical protein
VRVLLVLGSGGELNLDAVRPLRDLYELQQLAYPFGALGDCLLAEGARFCPRRRPKHRSVRTQTHQENLRCHMGMEAAEEFHGQNRRKLMNAS